MPENEGYDNKGADDDTVRKRVPASPEYPGDEKPLGAPEDAPADDSVNLKRRLGLISGIGLIVGTMIGSGIFISPKGVLDKTGSVGLSLCVWAACGVLSMLGAMCYLELGLLIPKSGCEYAYLRETFSPMHRFFGPIPAFLFNWTSLVVLKTSSVAIIALAFAAYVTDPLFPDCDSPEIPQKILAIVAILIITFVNCYSVKLATAIQNFFTAAKLLALIVIIIGGVVRATQGYTEVLATGFEGTSSSPSQVALAFYSGLWAYDGWNNLNFATEEVKNPPKNLPRAIMIGIPLVTVIYILTNMAYLTTMTTAQLLASDAVAVTYGEQVLGVMAWIIPVSVAMSTFGALNGTAFSTARLCYVAAREGHLVDVLSHVHTKRFTPAPALIFNATIALCMVIPGDIEGLIDFFSFAAWMFYGLTVLALLILRYTASDLDRPFKVPIVIPIVVLLASIYLVVAPIVEDPGIEYLYATIFIFAGLIFYVPFVYLRLHKTWLRPLANAVEKVTIFLQLFLQVSPPEKIPD